ncbi:solute-binding protein [bacterium]|nr:solute-binding protein [bacterium]
MQKRLIFYYLILLSICYFFLSCGGKQEHGANRTIKISGAWALYPMMVQWAQAYQQQRPEIRIDISAGGAGKGMADVLAGLADIGMVSREIRAEESARGAVFIPVVKDAVFPVINRSNPVYADIRRKGVTRSRFIDLWMKGTKLTWGDLTATPESKPVVLYTRSDACGAAETWAKYLGGQQEDLQGIAVYGDPGIAEAVRKDLLGIGYNNLGYAYDLQNGQVVQGLAVIPIDVNENGVIDTMEEIDSKEKAVRAIAAGIYPSPPARNLYLAAHKAFPPAADAFVRWILTEGQALVDPTGYIKLSSEQVQAALADLAKPTH